MEDLIIEHVSYLRNIQEEKVLPFCGSCINGTAVSHHGILANFEMMKALFSYAKESSTFVFIK
ncbi:hypothetical protein ACFSO7_21630 [Bacillus sp. CGMCC 1.16607]|uniref:hypothetical protein n=1 Tax=Bacillus sp. CGMCC 1.16607 TaxID=3351842 RepID=UPI00363019B3